MQLYSTSHVTFTVCVDTQLKINCIVFQVNSKVNGLRTVYQKRRKNYTRDAGTPPLAEDMLWAELDDDPLGIYTELGGRSSPSATPPQLRAMKLTVKETAEKIIEALTKIKEEASKVDMLKEQELSGKKVC